MFVEVGKGISPNFEEVLELLLNKEEFLAFAPDTEETRSMINIISVKFPLLKVPILIYCLIWLLLVYSCVFMHMLGAFFFFSTSELWHLFSILQFIYKSVEVFVTYEIC